MKTRLLEGMWGAGVKRYKIADVYLQVAGADYQTVCEQMRAYEAHAPLQPDVSIEFCKSDPVLLPGGIRVYAADAGRYYFEMPDGYGFYDRIGQEPITCFTADLACSRLTYRYCSMEQAIGVPDGTAVYNVLGNLFQQVLLHRGGVVIHASAIAYRGQAVAFSAPSGTGKSTHTALWKKYYPEVVQLNDDTPGLRMERGRCMAYGTPWSGKSSINCNLSAPLRALVFLERGTEDTIARITPFQAFGRLLSEIHLPISRHLTDLLAERLNCLVELVPAYVLRCGMTRRAVEVVREELFASC